MEEFSPSLAKEFMNHLKAECSSLAAIGDLAVKLKTLQIVFDITSATKYFELLLNKRLRLLDLVIFFAAFHSIQYFQQHYLR